MRKAPPGGSRLARHRAIQRVARWLLGCGAAFLVGGCGGGPFTSSTSSPDNSGLWAVDYAAGLFVAVGNNSTIMISTDGAIFARAFSNCCVAL
jgi:hypothetical protein